MKKISLLIFVSCISFIVSAQEFKKFRWGLGLGYTMPGGSGSKGGILLCSEPSYRINDKILVGLKIEFAAMARGCSRSITADLNISTASSYSINGQYYFNNNGCRPFVGLGFGLYSIKAVSFSFNGQDDTIGSDQSKFGFYPRIGVDAGHCTMLLDCNLISATKIASDEGTFINSYLGMRIGVNIGGGRK